MNNNVLFGITEQNMEVGRVKFTKRFTDHETGDTKRSPCGVVEWFGYIEPDSIGPDAKFFWNNGYQIHAGADTPVFSNDLLSGHPRSGDKVVFVRDSRGTIGWGYLDRYEKAILEIANRPIYRVVVTGVRFKGQFTPRRGDCVTEVVRGVMEQLASKYPRGIENDRLGVSFRAGPCEDWQKWQRLGRVKGNDTWVDCADPRPVLVVMAPPKVTEAEPEPVAVQGFDVPVMDDRELEELAAMAGGRNGKRHPKPAELVEA